MRRSSWCWPLGSCPGGTPDQPRSTTPVARDCRPLSIPKLLGEQVHEEGVVPRALGAPFAAAPDAHRTESHLRVAADGGPVVGSRIDLEAVMAVVPDEVTGHGAHRIL